MAPHASSVSVTFRYLFPCRILELFLLLALSLLPGYIPECYAK